MEGRIDTARAGVRSRGVKTAAVVTVGAIPAAVLALVTQALFELLERWAGPRRPTRG